MANPLPVDEIWWYCKSQGIYSRTSQEAEWNAIRVWYGLNLDGYTLEAACGVLGSIEVESNYNPWRWQIMYQIGDTPPNVEDIGTDYRVPDEHGVLQPRGYGLFQYTPANKYVGTYENGVWIPNQYAEVSEDYAPNFANLPGSDLDAWAQIDYLDYQYNYPQIFQGAWIPNVPMSWEEYKNSTENQEDLAEVWVRNYERPGDWQALLDVRKEAASYWYDILSQYDPPIPVPLGRTTHKLPIWMYFI